MKNTIQIIFAILIIAIFNNCTKSPCRTTYSFDIPLSISPALDTFQIGDTIWLTSTIENQLLDKNSNELIDVSDFDFKIKSNMSKVDTNIFFYAEPYFEYIYEEGEFNITIYPSSNVTSDVIYNKTVNNKTLRIGMIPDITGLFRIAFYNLTEDLREVNLTESNCIEKISISYVMNNGGDNNYDLMDENKQQEINTKAGFEKDGGYAFMIVE